MIPEFTITNSTCSWNFNRKISVNRYKIATATKCLCGIEQSDIILAELTAFGTGVGEPKRLFKREIWDDHRTV